MEGQETGAPAQSAKEGMREPEAEMEERAGGCPSSLCPPGGGAGACPQCRMLLALFRPRGAPSCAPNSLWPGRSPAQALDSGRCVSLNLSPGLSWLEVRGERLSEPLLQNRINYQPQGVVIKRQVQARVCHRCQARCKTEPDTEGPNSWLTSQGGAGMEPGTWAGSRGLGQYSGQCVPRECQGGEEPVLGRKQNGPALGRAQGDHLLTGPAGAVTARLIALDPSRTQVAPALFRSQALSVPEKLKVIIRRCDKQSAWKRLRQTLWVLQDHPHSASWGCGVLEAWLPHPAWALHTLQPPPRPDGEMLRAGMCLVPQHP